jgi:hypothetical protein
MCADVAENAGRPDPASSFTVAMLSILDALMDVPMRDVINPLPLADDVKGALSDRNGDKGGVLMAAVAYERAAWDELDATALDPGAPTDSSLLVGARAERGLRSPSSAHGRCAALRPVVQESIFASNWSSSPIEPNT